MVIPWTLKRIAKMNKLNINKSPENGILAILTMHIVKNARLLIFVFC